MKQPLVCTLIVVAALVLITPAASFASGGESGLQAGVDAPVADAADDSVGIALPDSPKLRLTVDFLAGYGSDASNAMLGFSRQGRVGYVIFAVRGAATARWSYLISVNPVNEIDPLPGCGVAGFFFPNEPKMLYGQDTNVACEAKNGNRRVDSYRGIALDVAPQQGAIREAYLDLRVTDRLKFRFGRTKLPIGFDWQEAGSFTAKDAPRIQRINAEHSFGTMLSYTSPLEGRSRPLYSGNVAAYLGEGHRYWDYNYFYFEDSSLHSNVDLTMLLSGTLSPTKSLELRGAYQTGKTGSKVERLPSYWASKRNDNAVVVGASYQLGPAVRLIAEHASYTWGPTKSSASMLGSDYSGIHKRGYYLTAEVHHQLFGNVVVGGSVTREKLDRDDSLIKFMAVQHRFGVTTGRRDRMLALRAYADIGGRVRIGFYNTMNFNPYPWLSGISPVTGPDAFRRSSTNKWGVMTRLRVI